MKQPVSIEFTNRLTAEQLLAIYDLCQTISAHLWQHHEHVLLEQMIEQDRAHGHVPLSAEANDNLELPFDDELPF